VRRFVAALGGALLLAGCGCEHGVISDGYPIDVDMSGGPVMASIREGDGATRAAVIDLLAPLTVLDTDADAPPSRRCADLTLLDTGGVPRAHLACTATVLHACPGTTCQVGSVTPVAVEAVIGGDAFAPGAVRFDFVAGQLSIFPDIAGDGPARGRLCEAQISDPFRGGGTLFLGGSEVSFPARRITVGACLSYDPEEDAELTSDGGADAQLVLSTGIGPTLLSESAYERWRAASGTGEPVAALPTGSVWMPSGEVTGRAATIDRVALVGGYDDRRGPCRQVYAHRLLSIRDCDGDDDCPCADGRICRVPSIVELAPADPIAVLVIPDDDPMLQALRTELRPRTAEVDGILGTGALAATSIDVDPPNNRVLVRCEAAGCRVRPELITDDLRPLIADCLARAAP